MVLHRTRALKTGTRLRMVAMSDEIDFFGHLSAQDEKDVD